MNAIAFQIVVFLSFLLLLWYFIGSYLNRRQSYQILKWIREGLGALGEKISLRWLGVSGFQIMVERPQLPFNRVGLIVILEPRSMLLAWIVQRLKGGKSLISIKGDFQTEPELEFEIFDPRSRIGKEALQTVTREKWVFREIEDTAFLRSSHNADNLDRLARLSPPLQPWLSNLLRISIRKKSPHLLASFSLPGLETRKAEELFTFLKELKG